MQEQQTQAPAISTKSGQAKHEEEDQAMYNEVGGLKLETRQEEEAVQG